MIGLTANSYTAIGDVITLVIWTALAGSSILLLRRLDPLERGAWYIIALYCVVVAVDKAVDLQIALYNVVRWLVDVLDPQLGIRQHKGAIRILLLGSITVTTVGCSIWLVRRDRRLDRNKKLAIAGLVLVILLVGLRLVSNLQFIDESTGWIIEGSACLMIGCALRQAWRNVRPT